MASAAVQVGELACQKAPFLRELIATVISCDVATQERSKKEKAKNGLPMYDVVLSDSLLFPEGGGQPCDYGVLEILTTAAPEEGTASTVASQDQHVDIQDVQRRGNECILKSPTALPVGAVVRQMVDWPRRLDHMQHHTAQHLLTAVVERSDTMLLPTISWSLTHPYCFIQVDVGAYASDPTSPYHRFITKEKKICDEMLQQIEQKCNALIQNDNVPVHCDIYESRDAYEKVQQRREEVAAQRKQQENDMGEEEPAFRSRGIPKDVTGAIRIISVGDIDSCTCCGTHLHHLSQLGMILLLHQEVKGTTVKLHFITGERVKQHYHDMYARERQLMQELGGCRPSDFCTTVQRRSKETTDVEKRMKRWALELAGEEAKRIIADISLSSASVVTLRRDDVELDYFNTVRQQLDQAGMKHVVLVSAWAEERCVTAPLTAAKDVQGQIFITGGDAPEAIAKVVAVVKEVMPEFKGGTSRLGFRGKGSIKEWGTLVKLLQKAEEGGPPAQ